MGGRRGGSKLKLLAGISCQPPDGYKIWYASFRKWTVFFECCPAPKADAAPISATNATCYYDHVSVEKYPKITIFGRRFAVKWSISGVKIFKKYTYFWLAICLKWSIFGLKMSPKIQISGWRFALKWSIFGLKIPRKCLILFGYSL